MLVTDRPLPGVPLLLRQSSASSVLGGHLHGLLTDSQPPLPPTHGSCRRELLKT